MQCREADRAKRLHDDPRSPQRVPMILRDVHGAEGVVEDEHAHARLRTFTQDLAERVRQTTGRAVIQLQRDRPLRRAQVLPQAGEGSVAVLHQLDAVAWREPRAGRHRRHQWELLLGYADRRAISGDATNVANGRSAREVKKADQRESEDDCAQRPATDPAQDGDTRLVVTRMRVSDAFFSMLRPFAPSSDCSAKRFEASVPLHSATRSALVHP